MLTYERECELIDKLMILSSVTTNDIKLIKKASIISDLGGLASSLQDRVKARIKEEGALGTLATYLSPSVLLMLPTPLNIIGAILTVAASAMGWSPGAILSKAFDLAQQVLTSKGKITESDASQIADSAVSGLASSASLIYLHELEKKGKLNSIITKHAAGSGGIIGWITSWFSSSSASKSVKSSLAAGFFRWAIKSILLGVAAFEVVPMAINWITGRPLSGTGAGIEKGEYTAPSGSIFPSTVVRQEYKEEESKPEIKISYSLPKPIQHSLKYSGKGSSYFNNDYPNYWMIKLVNQSIPQTLLAWANEIYPELVQYSSIITGLPSFNRVVGEMSKTYNSQESPDYLIVLPNSGIHSWKEIVDLFAGEAAQQIQALQGK